MNIVNYNTKYKDELMSISMEWLKHYELLEDIDTYMLSNPEHIIEKGGHILLAQEDNSEIVGMIMIENHGKSCELLKLGVKKSSQGKGIGQCLLMAAIQIASDEGKEKVSLSSNHQLKKALHLYEKLGFQYVSYEKKQFELSDISMELLL